MTDITLPKMGLTMEEGTVVTWLKNTGDIVEKGEAIVEVQTDKSVLEIESPISGWLGEIIIEAGETTQVGAKIGTIVDDSGQVLQSENIKKSSGNKTPQLIIAETDRIRCSPAARRLAKEYDINLQTVKGSGPFGRIVLSDIYQSIDNQTTRKEDQVVTKGHKQKVTGTRKVIAQRLIDSVNNTPQFTLSRTINCTNIQNARDAMNKLSEGSLRISVNDMLFYAIAKVIQKHPRFNNYYVVENSEHYIVENEAINLGLAVATNDGLLVPVIKNVQGLSLIEIANERKRIIEVTLAGKLKPQEMQEGTFTISNLGGYDIERFTAIINPPESGIIAVSTIKNVPIVNDEGAIIVAPIMEITGSFDHRLIDGADGAKFIQDLVIALERDKWNLF